MQAGAKAEGRPDLESLKRWLREQGAAPVEIAQPGVESGIEALDRDLLGGGFPIGGITALVGPSGVGRMTLAAMVLARETQAGRAVAWIDGRGTLYPPALVRLGVRLERLLIVRSEERDKAASAAREVIESGAFRVVVLSGLDQALTSTRARRILIATEAARVATIALLDSADRLHEARLRLRLKRRGERITVELDRSTRAPAGKKVSVRVA